MLNIARLEKVGVGIQPAVTQETSRCTANPPPTEATRTYSRLHRL